MRPQPAGPDAGQIRPVKVLLQAQRHVPRPRVWPRFEASVSLGSSMIVASRLVR
jgi:hypothetical protein